MSNNKNGANLGFENQMWAAAGKLREHGKRKNRPSTRRTVDWTVRDNARAQIRVIVKRILRKYGYSPDKQEKATQTVLEQAEVLCKEWTDN